MHNFFIYIIESGISLFLFYAIYWLFLKSITHFNFSRFYLLTTLILSFLVPLIDIPVIRQSPEIEYFNLINTVVVTADDFEHAVSKHLNSSQLLLYIYCIGAGLFFIRFIYLVFQIIRLILISDIKKNGSLKFVVTNSSFAPFSFLNYIFISKKMESQDFRKILLHEKIHVNQWHSLDIILSELFIILQWFNPFIWLYKNSVQEVHEYLADRGVLNHGYDPVSYQKLIYNQLFGLNNVRLANFFNYSLTKRRFIMMTKIKSPKSVILRVLIFIPVLALVVLAFSCSNEDIDKNESYEITDSKLLNDDSKVYEKVEVMPAFPGGTDALIKFIVSEVKYPEKAKERGVSGKVFVGFVVNKDGQVENVEILQGVAKDYKDDQHAAALLLEKEALRVVKQFPNWVPGIHEGEHVKVKFTIPINFALE